MRKIACGRTYPCSSFKYDLAKIFGFANTGYMGNLELFSSFISKTISCKTCIFKRFSQHVNRSTKTEEARGICFTRHIFFPHWTREALLVLIFSWQQCRKTPRLFYLVLVEFCYWFVLKCGKPRSNFCFLFLNLSYFNLAEINILNFYNIYKLGD